MSRLTDFYRGTGTDSEGRTLSNIWEWEDEDLECVHDYIQWMSPLPEASRFNPAAPLLTESDLIAFQTEPVLKMNLEKSFLRILNFFGLHENSENRIVEGANFQERVPDVWAFRNHNWLRISRILQSLTLLGLETQGAAFFQWLEATYSKRCFPITFDTFQYWENAIAGE